MHPMYFRLLEIMRYWDKHYPQKGLFPPVVGMKWRISLLSLYRCLHFCLRAKDSTRQSPTVIHSPYANLSYIMGPTVLFNLWASCYIFALITATDKIAVMCAWLFPRTLPPNIIGALEKVKLARGRTPLHWHAKQGINMFDTPPTWLFTLFPPTDSPNSWTVSCYIGQATKWLRRNKKIIFFRRKCKVKTSFFL